VGKYGVSYARVLLQLRLVLHARPVSSCGFTSNLHQVEVQQRRNKGSMMNQSIFVYGVFSSMSIHLCLFIYVYSSMSIHLFLFIYVYVLATSGERRYDASLSLSHAHTHLCLCPLHEGKMNVVA
jgi:hypothetical protein